MAARSGSPDSAKVRNLDEAAAEEQFGRWILERPDCGRGFDVFLHVPTPDRDLMPRGRARSPIGFSEAAQTLAPGACSGQ